MIKKYILIINMCWNLFQQIEISNFWYLFVKFLLQLYFNMAISIERDERFTDRFTIQASQLNRISYIFILSYTL